MNTVNPVIIFVNQIARALGHGCALSDEKVAHCATIRELYAAQDAQATADARRYAEEGYGWAAYSPWAIQGGRIFHVTQSGRLHIEAADGWVTLAIWAGTTPYPRQVAIVTLVADEIPPALVLKSCTYKAELLYGEEGECWRLDRLDLLDRIDRQAGSVLRVALGAAPYDQEAVGLLRAMDSIEQGYAVALRQSISPLPESGEIVSRFFGELTAEYAVGAVPLEGQCDNTKLFGIKHRCAGAEPETIAMLCPSIGVATVPAAGGWPSWYALPTDTTDPVEIVARAVENRLSSREADEAEQAAVATERERTLSVTKIDAPTDRESICQFGCEEPTTFYSWSSEVHSRSGVAAHSGRYLFSCEGDERQSLGEVLGDKPQVRSTLLRMVMGRLIGSQFPRGRGRRQPS